MPAYSNRDARDALIVPCRLPPAVSKQAARCTIRLLDYKRCIASRRWWGAKPEPCRVLPCFLAPPKRLAACSRAIDVARGGLRHFANREKEVLGPEAVLLQIHVSRLQFRTPQEAHRIVRDVRCPRRGQPAFGGSVSFSKPMTNPTAKVRQKPHEASNHAMRFFCINR